MNHSERQTALAKLIESGNYSNQSELLSQLKKMKMPATQGTLSRDLGKLGVNKVGGKYSLQPVGESLNGHSKIISIQAVPPSFIIVKTTPGLASASAHLIDTSNLVSVVGTIAGDDTILVIVNSTKKISNVQKTLVQLFQLTRRRP